MISDPIILSLVGQNVAGTTKKQTVLTMLFLSCRSMSNLVLTKRLCVQYLRPTRLHHQALSKGNLGSHDIHGHTFDGECLFVFSRKDRECQA